MTYIFYIRQNDSIIYHRHNDGYFYRLDDTLSDLLIIFENIAGETDEYMRSREFVDRIKNCEKKIETKFFIFDSYKKNTLHITYRSKRYLDIFNIMASKGKMWLKSDFGEKPYSDMSNEEKKQAKEFGFSMEDVLEKVYDRPHNIDINCGFRIGHKNLSIF